MLFVTIALATESFTSSTLAGPVPPVASNPSVTLKNGTYQGVHSQSYNQDYFLGVPYAQPPLGELRLNFPQSLNSSFSDVKTAQAFGPICAGYGVCAACESQFSAVSLILIAR
jgi:cholinesterase